MDGNPSNTVIINEYERKIVLVGDILSGKTSLLYMFTSGNFPESEFIGAIAYDRTKDILVDKKTVKLTLYDTGSSGDYDQLRISTYPDTSILLLCFSIKNKESFQNIEERWIPEILHYFSESPVPFLLIGCQKDARYGWDLKDMTPKDLVTVEEAERMAKRIGAAMYLECSAYTGEGVNEVFEHAARITMPKLKWKKNGTCLVI